MAWKWEIGFSWKVEVQLQSNVSDTVDAASYITEMKYHNQCQGQIQYAAKLHSSF